MADLSNVEKQKLEALLEMGGGYVLDFTNRTFQDFLITSVGQDPYLVKYQKYGSSKANILRAFWDIEPNQVVGKVLSEMLERWRTNVLLSSGEPTPRESALYTECSKIITRMTGKSPESGIADDFLARGIEPIDASSLKVGTFLEPTLRQRVQEIAKCQKAGAALACIFLCGSTLEGILLEVATRNAKIFNQAKAAPLDPKTQKVLPLRVWSLNSLIDVAAELGCIGQDVKKFSHSLRDFRNYIHPHQQAVEGFSPDRDTSDICYKVLQVAVAQLVRSGK